MMTTLIINLALIVTLLATATSAGDIQYPTSSLEIKFIDSATRRPSASPSEEKDSPPDLVEDVSRSLRAQLELLRSVKGHDERSVELLEQYLKLANINEENCKLPYADELVFVLHVHQHDPDSNAFKYAQEVATRQFKLCLAGWDGEFAEAIDSIDESYRERMDRLLDQMMTIKFKNERQQPSRPYKKEQLRQLISNPPASAILLFMVSLDTREVRIPVDENLKNLRFKWSDFQKVYEDMVLRMCYVVCDTLEPSSLVFRRVFDYNIESSRYENVNHRRDIWMANKMICCSIKKSHEEIAKTGEDVFMKSTFDKLTIQEEIMIDNQPGLDELIAFGQTLDED